MAITALYSGSGHLGSNPTTPITLNSGAIVGDLLLIGLVTDTNSNFPSFPAYQAASGDPAATLLRTDVVPSTGMGAMLFSTTVTAGLLAGNASFLSLGGLLAFNLVTLRNATTVISNGGAAAAGLSVVGPTVLTPGSGIYVVSFFGIDLDSSFVGSPTCSNPSQSSFRTVATDYPNDQDPTGPYVLSYLADTLGFASAAYAVGTLSFAPQTPVSSVGSICQTVAVAPATPPGAPTGVVAAEAHKGAVISWTPPTVTGGQPITGYTITPSGGSPSPVTVGNVTTVTISGLAVGVSKTFTVQAINAQGAGTASSASNPVWATSNNMNGLVF